MRLILRACDGCLTTLSGSVNSPERFS